MLGGLSRPHENIQMIKKHRTNTRQLQSDGRRARHAQGMQLSLAVCGSQFTKFWGNVGALSI